MPSDATQEKGRLVLAVPGSPGAGALIAQGAESLDLDTANLDALVRRLGGQSSPHPLRLAN